MAITDLTGTRWLLNSSLTLNSAFDYYINFNYQDQYGVSIDATSLQVYDIRGSFVLSYMGQDVYSGSWVNEAYRIIEITGGTDATNATLIAWLQANATQVPVVDLTGTKWVLNSSLGTFPGWLYYNLNLQSNGQTFSAFAFDGGDNTFLKYGTDNVYRFGVGNVGWINAAYRIIEIVGGTDATNATLIEWLISNATQVPVADLTGTEWVWNSKPVVQEGESTNFNISFTSNGNDYSVLRRSFVIEDYCGIKYGNSFVFQFNDDNGETYLDGTWTNDAYRTVFITGGTDAANPDLLVWLTQNATMQETPEPEPTGVKNILFGTQAIDKILFGQNEVSKIYLGQTLVWQAESASVQTGIAVTVSNNQSATSPHIYDGADTTGTDLGTVASGETKTFYIESGYISMAHTEGVLWVFYPDNVAVVAVSEPVSLAVQQSGGSND